MKPPDLRPTHWQQIMHTIRGDRLAVYEALLERGAAGATGSELAARMGLGVLTVRPRLTELRQAFLAEATGERRGSEHVLRGVPHAQASERWAAAQASTPRAREHQPALAPSPAPFHRAQQLGLF